MTDTNLGFIDCWNSILVPKWNRFRHILSGNGHIHSAIAYELFDIQAGDRVLDVGCGYGETSIEIGRKVGPEGEVLGLDCTDAFLEIARDETQTAGLSNVSFVNGDAQTHDLPENYYDIAYSRFGVMFFQSAVMALRNMHKSLQSGGKVCLIVWRGLEFNPCWGKAKEIALHYLPPPGDDAQSCGPGPFSMASEETDRAMLKAAGFNQVEVFEAIDTEVQMGNDLEEAVDFQILVGPSGEIIREAGEAGQEKLPEIRADMKAMLSEYLVDGGVKMPSSTWAIMARK